MYISFWHGLWVQKGTPKHVIAKLNNAVVETLADQTVRQRLTDLGQIIAAARPADTQRARRLSQGRDREVVAHHQGGKHQGRLTRSGSKVLRISSILEIGNAQ